MKRSYTQLQKSTNYIQWEIPNDIMLEIFSYMDYIQVKMFVKALSKQINNQYIAMAKEWHSMKISKKCREIEDTFYQETPDHIKQILDTILQKESLFKISHKIGKKLDTDDKSNHKEYNHWRVHTPYCNYNSQNFTAVSLETKYLRNYPNIHTKLVDVKYTRYTFKFTYLITFMENHKSYISLYGKKNLPNPNHNPTDHLNCYKNIYITSTGLETKPQYINMLICSNEVNKVINLNTVSQRIDELIQEADNQNKIDPTRYIYNNLYTCIRYSVADKKKIINKTDYEFMVDYAGKMEELVPLQSEFNQYITNYKIELDRRWNLFLSVMSDI